MNKVFTIILAVLLLPALLSPVSCQPVQREGSIENPLLPKDAQEEHILKVLEKMRHGARYANVSVRDGRLLRMLTESTNAQRVVEVGTSTGESAVWMALALRKTGGKLFTHEIDARRARIARQNFKEAGVDNIITLIEGNAHETVKRYTEPIDIVFLDADKPGYPDYLEKLLPLVRPGGLIIAHNMHSPRPDPDYIDDITQNPELETAFLYMTDSGIGVTLKKR